MSEVVHTHDHDIHDEHEMAGSEASDGNLPHLARHVARLLITLYHAGTSSHSLWDGETRQVGSIAQVRQFEFWLREPGHLALALLKIAAVQPAQAESIQTDLAQMLIDDSIDHRRVQWPGAPLQSLPDLHEALSFLSSRALVSDRPSFSSGPHQIVLETAGIEFVQRILETCPLFGWYDFLGQVVSRAWIGLAAIDLNTMAYLAPDLTPTQAASGSLLPIVRARLALLPR